MPSLATHGIHAKGHTSIQGVRLTHACTPKPQQPIQQPITRCVRIQGGEDTQFIPPTTARATNPPGTSQPARARNTARTGGTKWLGVRRPSGHGSPGSARAGRGVGSRDQSEGGRSAECPVATVRVVQEVGLRGQSQAAATAECPVATVRVGGSLCSLKAAAEEQSPPVQKAPSRPCGRPWPQSVPTGQQSSSKSKKHAGRLSLPWPQDARSRGIPLLRSRQFPTSLHSAFVSPTSVNHQSHRTNSQPPSHLQRHPPPEINHHILGQRRPQNNALQATTAISPLTFQRSIQCKPALSFRRSCIRVYGGVCGSFPYKTTRREKAPSLRDLCIQWARLYGPWKVHRTCTSPVNLSPCHRRRRLALRVTTGSSFSADLSLARSGCGRAWKAGA
jgi:hypothetical protein